MEEKAINKIETKDPGMRDEIVKMLRDKGFEICPFMIRIYDYISITGRNGGNSNGKQVAAQCIYLGTVHNPGDLCIGNFDKCRKYTEIREQEEFMKR